MLSTGEFTTALMARGWTPNSRDPRKWTHKSGAQVRVDATSPAGGILMVYDRVGVLSNGLRYGTDTTATPERFVEALDVVETGGNQLQKRLTSA